MFDSLPPFIELMKADSLRNKRKLVDANGNIMEIEKEPEEPSLEESFKMSRQNIFEAKQRQIIELLQQDILDKINSGDIDADDMVNLSGAIGNHIKILLNSEDI